MAHDGGVEHPLGRPEEAYGRVTDPERYAVLHASVAPLLASLEDRHVVARSERGGGPDLFHGVDVLSTVRLEPAGGGAPVTVALTTFPGLAVRLGQWLVTYLPTCGCDACDERPDDLVTDLRRHLEAVAAGRFREELRRRTFGGGVLRHELWGDGWRIEGTGTIRRREARVPGRSALLEWPRWPRRE